MVPSTSQTSTSSISQTSDVLAPKNTDDTLSDSEAAPRSPTFDFSESKKRKLVGENQNEKPNVTSGKKCRREPGEILRNRLAGNAIKFKDALTGQIPGGYSRQQVFICFT